MILVDTSVWIDHLRYGDPELNERLQLGQILIHPLVVGELACGRLKSRSQIKTYLLGLPSAKIATEAEALAFIETHALYGLGIGYIDVHLCAAAKLSGGVLWTRDKRLQEVAKLLDMAHQEAHH